MFYIRPGKSAREQCMVRARSYALNDDDYILELNGEGLDSYGNKRLDGMLGRGISIMLFDPELCTVLVSYMDLLISINLCSVRYYQHIQSELG